MEMPWVVKGSAYSHACLDPVTWAPISLDPASSFAPSPLNHGWRRTSAFDENDACHDREYASISSAWLAAG
eukprot:1299384-Amphidinium_carterae.2